MRPKDVPATAELLPFQACFSFGREPSLLVPGQMQLVNRAACPACHEALPEISAVKPTACNCGLVLQNDVNGVYVWRVEMVEA